MASDEGWMQRLRSPRVAPADAVQMASLPDWHRASQRVAADPKRADKDAEKDGVSRRSISDAEIRPSAEINAKISLWRGDSAVYLFIYFYFPPKLFKKNYNINF